MSNNDKLYTREGREIKRAFSVPKYESLKDIDNVTESLTVKKPTEIFEDEASREALENVIDGILTQGGCGNDATLDIVHHKDGGETWNLRAYADSLGSFADDDNDGEDDRPALVVIVTIDDGGVIRHIEGQDGISAVINSRIDSQGFLDFLRSQVSDYVNMLNANTPVMGDASETGANVTPMNQNLREQSQDIARAVDATVQSVGADYILNMSRVYSSTLSEDALVTYTGNYSDKDRMPHKVEVLVVPYNGSLAFVIYSDGQPVKTAENIKDASAFADWVRDNVAYRMNEGRKLVLKHVH